MNYELNDTRFNITYRHRVRTAETTTTNKNQHYNNDLCLWLVSSMNRLSHTYVNISKS